MIIGGQIVDAMMRIFVIATEIETDHVLLQELQRPMLLALLEGHGMIISKMKVNLTNLIQIVVSLLVTERSLHFAILAV